MNITPGEWEAGLDLPGVANNNPDPRIVWAGSMMIGDFRSKWVDPERAANNARLAAAAPGLLKACQEMLNEIRAYNGESEFEDGSPVKGWCDMLKAEIAKAVPKEL